MDKKSHQNGFFWLAMTCWSASKNFFIFPNVWVYCVTECRRRAGCVFWEWSQSAKLNIWVIVLIWTPGCRRGFLLFVSAIHQLIVIIKIWFLASGLGCFFLSTLSPKIPRTAFWFVQEDRYFVLDIISLSKVVSSWNCAHLQFSYNTTTCCILQHI